MFRKVPVAEFDASGQPCCPTCKKPTAELQFGRNVRCKHCRAVFKLQKRREFLRLQHTAKTVLLSQTSNATSREAWIALTAEGRLTGVSTTDLRTCLSEAGKHELEIVDYLSASNGIVRQGARRAGRAMFLLGLFGIIVGVSIVLICYYFRAAGIAVVPIGFLAIGVVYTLVGLLKWITGWNIH
jgi:hypothetical protein